MRLKTKILIELVKDNKDRAHTRNLGEIINTELEEIKEQLEEYRRGNKILKDFIKSQQSEIDDLEDQVELLNDIDVEEN